MCLLISFRSIGVCLLNLAITSLHRKLEKQRKQFNAFSRSEVANLHRQIGRIQAFIRTDPNKGTIAICYLRSTGSSTIPIRTAYYHSDGRHTLCGRKGSQKLQELLNGMHVTLNRIAYKSYSDGQAACRRMMSAMRTGALWMKATGVRHVLVVRTGDTLQSDGLHVPSLRTSCKPIKE